MKRITAGDGTFPKVTRAFLRVEYADGEVFEFTATEPADVALNVAALVTRIEDWHPILPPILIQAPDPALHVRLEFDSRPQLRSRRAPIIVSTTRGVHGLLDAFRQVTGWSDELVMHFAECNGGCTPICGSEEDTCPDGRELA